MNRSTGSVRRVPGLERHAAGHAGSFGVVRRLRVLLVFAAWRLGATVVARNIYPNVAYVQPREGVTVDPETLAARAEQHLGGYKRPTS